MNTPKETIKTIRRVIRSDEFNRHCDTIVVKQGSVFVMSPGKESAPDSVEAASTADIVNTREYGKLDLRAIKVRRC